MIDPSDRVSCQRTPFSDPANDWDEDDGYEYDDTKPAERSAPRDILHPEYVGIVSGAQYRLEDGDGVAEYAVNFVVDGYGFMFAMSEDDLRCLARQIVGLLAK